MSARIFLVDPNDNTRNQLKSKLERDGVTVEAVANAGELKGVIEGGGLMSIAQGGLTEAPLAGPGSPVALIESSKLHLVTDTQPQSSTGDLSYTELKKKWCDSFEKEYLVSTLNRNGGNVSAAARAAKLDRSNFLRLLRRHGLRAQEYRKMAA